MLRGSKIVSMRWSILVWHCPSKIAHSVFNERTLIKYFLLILFSLGLATVYAQVTNFRFEHLTVADGLSQAQPNCFFQDSEGYLWIGTQDGLNRYDGYTFKVYKNNPFDSTTLTHNWVWAVAEDDDKNLWIGTFQGLCKYIRGEDRFEQYYHQPNNPNSISGNRPNAIVKDKQGRLWISCWGSGINMYDKQTKTFTRFLHDEKDQQSIGSNAVRTLFCDRQGTLWIGTWNAGLNKLIEGESGMRFQRFTNFSEVGFDQIERITSIAEDKVGNLWIGSLELGLLQLDVSRSRFTRWPQLSAVEINKILCDSKGNLWIGSNSGVYVLDDRTKQFTAYQHNSTNPHGISNNIVYTLYEDRSGILWISGNGIDTYDPKKNIFNLYQHQPSAKSSLSNNFVWSFCEDDNGKIWIGTNSGALNLFDPITKHFEFITIADKRGNVATNIQRMVLQGDVLWLVTVSSGLVRYNVKTKEAYFFEDQHPSALGSITAYNDILLNSDQTLWIASRENGLFHFDPKTNNVKQYTASADSTSIGANYINGLYKDRAGVVWISLWGGGLSRYNAATDNFINYRYDRKNKYGISDQMVNGIYQQNDSIYWIGTQTGLNKLNKLTGRVTHFFEKDGLGNNVVYEIIPDDFGFLWLSTNGGLSRFHLSTESFVNFTVADGLQSNEFNTHASLRSSTGELYFGGINGITSFNPAAIRSDTTAPKLLLEHYRIFDKLFRPEVSVSLPYHENYIGFKFTAIEFSHPTKINYHYKLDDVDANWISTLNREANYNNVRPGKYTFSVKAANSEGIWSETVSMQLIITPPFWTTWWFIILMVLLVGLLMYGVHRYRLAQLIKVQHLRNKIASDLHDEVGSSLTRISIYSDLLQSGTPDKDGRSYLSGIGELSRDVVSAMSDIVWSIDNRSDSMGSIMLRMKDFASETLQAKQIEFEFSAGNIDESKTLDPALKQNLYLLVKEAINNAVKHANATRISVQLINGSERFALIIKDNGKGLPENISEKGNGLRNMKRRAAAIQAVLDFKNDNGLTITVTRKSL